MHGIERENSLRELEEIIEKQKLQIKKLTSGGFMAAKLHNELAEIPAEERDGDEIKDGYQLKFIGKDYAKLQAGLKTETVITPDFEHNSKPENQNSENIFITGDNLDALKHLESAYSGKVDMIYIDPPYNTGSDRFIYADNFKFSDDDLKEKLGLTDTEISRVRALNGKSSHSAWLTFMLPRLMIAKRLLSDTGVIFISIDDNEQASLKNIMDEIFGEQNSEMIIWKKKGGSGNTESILGTVTEYVLCYFKKKNAGILNYQENTEREYKFKDGEGVYNLEGIEKTNSGTYERRTMLFNIKNPETGSNFRPGLNMRWTVGEDTVKELLRHKQLFFDEVKGKVYRIKRPEHYQDSKTVYNNIFENVGSLSTAKNELKNLHFPREAFDTPKPTQLIKHILKIASQKNSLILDFFAGSATTADAVMQLNAEDGGNRKFILVQLPETVAKGSEAEKAGYKTIDQISRERIIRAAAKIGDKSGFKHFRLTAPKDENSLLKMEEFDPNANIAFPEDMTATFDGGEEAILQTWLIDDGFEFNQTPETVEFAGYKAHYIENRLYLISTGWSSDATRELLNKIGKNQLAVQTIVIFPYSFSFNELNELKTNLRTAFEKSNKIEVVERY